MGGGVLSGLFKALSKAGVGAVDDSIKYGYKLGQNELRDITTNSIADNVIAGNTDTARDVLRNSPMLIRTENAGRTLNRTAPEYQNVALTTLNDAPMGFGMVDRNHGTHMTALDPDLMNRPGQKALALEDTAWQAPRGMNPIDAQNRFFIDEFGGKKIDSSREALRDVAWDDDFLRGLEDTGWGELNAPISRSDVLSTGYKPHDTHGYKISSRQALEDNIIDEIGKGKSRDEVMKLINKYLPVYAGAIPTAGVLGSMFSQQPDQQNMV